MWVCLGFSWANAQQFGLISQPAGANSYGATSVAQVGDCVALSFLDAGDSASLQMQRVIEDAVGLGWVVRTVDMRREAHLVERWRVHTAPTTILVRAGREVDRILGEVSLLEFTQRMIRSSAADSLRGVQVKVPSPAGGLVRHQSATNELGRGELVPMRPIQPVATATEGSFSAGGGTGATIGVNDSARKERALRSTVRIIVEEPSHQAVGTGTIIDSQQGEALVLTCGHLFRDMSPNSPISIEVFERGVPVAYRGELIHHEIEEKDIGLVVFRPRKPVDVAPVVSRGRGVNEGQKVFSVGCDHGQLPSVRDSLVTKLNRYIGASNIETSGAPVQGRSGGGLFNDQGELVGVCYAADGQLDEGLYCGTEVLYEQITKLGLERLIEPKSGAGEVAPSKLAVQYIDAQGRVQQVQINRPSEPLLQAIRTEAQGSSRLR
jgi:hypothetical protein